MAKGRKGRVKATLTPVETPPPPRRTKPIVPLNDPNGATAFVLAAYGIDARPADAEEREAFTRYVAPVVAPGFHTPAGNTPDMLTFLVKELPAVVTFLPADPYERWETATSWIATTKAPNYTSAHVRELDPEFMAEGRTPLLAAIALLQYRLSAQKWAPIGGNFPPRIQLYAVYADYVQRGYANEYKPAQV